MGTTTAVAWTGTIAAVAVYLYLGYKTTKAIRRAMSPAELEIAESTRWLRVYFNLIGLLWPVLVLAAIAKLSRRKISTGQWTLSSKKQQRADLRPQGGSPSRRPFERRRR